ncbi:MAG: hypothetical protein LQ337_008604 [Flavoplaca oasis]|nr:MAG: hypothetical protein LQ337_008604 [Flavoplaca oasis]
MSIYKPVAKTSHSSNTPQSPPLPILETFDFWYSLDDFKLKHQSFRSLLDLVEQQSLKAVSHPREPQTTNVQTAQGFNDFAKDIGLLAEKWNAWEKRMQARQKRLEWRVRNSQTFVSAFEQWLNVDSLVEEDSADS